MRDLGERAQVCESLSELQRTMYRGITRLVGCDSGVCVDANSTSLGWRFGRGQPFGVTDSELRSWCQDYQVLDPFVVQLSRLFRRGNKRVFTSSDIKARINYEGNAFYNEFLKPQSIYHVMTIGLDKVNQPRGVPGGMIGLHRSKRNAPFSERDIALVEALLPYYTRAMQLVQIKDMTTERRSIVEVLSGEPPLRGTMILDHDYVPTYIDEEVLDLLGLPRPTNSHLPEMLSREITRDIRAACEGLRVVCETGKSTVLSARFTARDGREIVCRVHARTEDTHRPHFVVCLLYASESAGRSAVQRFNLTAREVEVAHLIVKGMTNPQIAHVLNISVRTVQNHLRAIYEKVHVHNRTGLATMFLSAGRDNNVV